MVGVVGVGGVVVVGSAPSVTSPTGVTNDDDDEGGEAAAEALPTASALRSVVVVVVAVVVKGSTICSPAPSGIALHRQKVSPGLLSLGGGVASEFWGGRTESGKAAHSYPTKPFFNLRVSVLYTPVVVEKGDELFG